MTESDSPHTISWLRAIVTAVVFAAAAVALLVLGANAMLTDMHRVRRSALVGIVTPLFFLVVIALAAALRWMQRRKIV